MGKESRAAQMVSTCVAPEGAEGQGRWTEGLESRMPGNWPVRCAPWGALWYSCCKQGEL